MVKRAIEKKLPAAIYRLGFVLCDSVTGVGNPDDYMGRMIVDTLTLGIYPLLPLQRKELLPVDYAVSAILSTSLSIDNLGKAYHITPDLEEANSMDITSLFEVIVEITGRSLCALPYDQWVMKLKEFSRNNEALLKPLMPILEETVLNNKTRWELYENMARFRNDNTRAALLKAKQFSLLERSAVTKSSLRLYLGHLGFSSEPVGHDGLGKSSVPVGTCQDCCGSTV
jgi:Putative dehydrogenase domain of multifunctional non-ribosomal peptide synthetases and related enzymes